MQENISLIGTYHHDIKGKSRLEKMLDFLKPDILTVEFPPEGSESYELLTQYEKELENKIMNQKDEMSELAVKIMKTSGYEHNVARDYSEKNSIPLYLIDDPEETIELDRQFREMEDNIQEIKDKVTGYIDDKLGNTGKIAIEKAKSGLSAIMSHVRNNKPIQDLRHIAYIKLTDLNYTKFSLENNAFLIKDTLLGKRDVYMYKKIKELNGLFPESKIVHVGGAGHVINTPRAKKKGIINIGLLLPRSKVYLLNEADKL